MHPPCLRWLAVGNSVSSQQPSQFAACSSLAHALKLLSLPATGMALAELMASPPQQLQRQRRQQRPADRCRTAPGSQHTQPTPPTLPRGRSARTTDRRRPRATFTSLSLLLATCLCWWVQGAAGAAGPGASSLTLRVRMPDGAVKRVKATATDTADGIMSKLGMADGGGGGGEGLSTDAGGGGVVVDGSASVAALGLGNGDFLYVKVCTCVLVVAAVMRRHGFS